MAEAAALATVGWVVSPIISKLVNKACSCLGDEAAQKLKDLETIILPKIQSVIEAAETTGNVQLGPWLRELKVAAHEAEDLLDEHEYYLLEEKVKRKAEDQVSSLSTSLLPAAKSLRKIGSKAKGILVPIKPKTKLIKSLDRLKKVAARVDEFVHLLNLHNNIKNNPNLVTSSSAKQHEMATQRPTASSSSVIYGRDEEHDFLINLLVSVGDEPESCSSNWKIPVFAICGIGGAGKTALAQYIFNDRRAINNFDVRMWVQVSREFDVSTVTRKMIESASEGECPHIENLDTLQTLTLSWDSPERDVKHDEDLQVLEGLEPPLSLEGLRISHYKGVRLPNWMSENRCLHALTIEACTELVEVPRLHHTLRKLVIFSCPKLMKLPSLPPNLSELRIASCPKLIQVSPFPQNLEELHISGCPGIEPLMSDLSCDDEEEGHVVLTTPLKVLKIKDSTVSQVIFFRCLRNFISLSILQINNCQQLTCLFLDRLRALQYLFIYRCQNLTSLEGLELLLHLRRLRVSDCPSLTLFTVLNDDGCAPLPLSLQSLKLYSCGDLNELAMTRFLLGLNFLRYLTICGFSHLQSLDLSQLRALQVLEISKCPELTSVGSLLSLISLHDVKILDCPKLAASRVGDRGLSSVKHICVDELLLLAVILQDEGLNSLQSLTIMSCSQDVPFSSMQEEIFQHLTVLSSLTFDDCLNLPALPGNLEKLSALKQLAVSICPKIDSLPNLPASLGKLRISHCNVKLISSAKKAVLPTTKLVTD